MWRLDRLRHAQPLLIGRDFGDTAVNDLKVNQNEPKSRRPSKSKAVSGDQSVANSSSGAFFGSFFFLSSRVVVCKWQRQAKRGRRKPGQLRRCRMDTGAL
jgi:hypothetical protein